MKDQCQKQVYGSSYHGHLCPRKPWKDGFCKQHHPDTVAAFLKARDAKWEAKWAKQEAAAKKTVAIAACGRAVIDAAEKEYDHDQCGTRLLSSAVFNLRKVRDE